MNKFFASLTAGSLLLVSLPSYAFLKVNAYLGISYPHYKYSDISISNTPMKLQDDVNDATISPGIGIGYAHLFEGKVSKVLHDATIGVDYFFERSEDNGQVLANANPDDVTANYSMTFNAHRLMLNTEIGLNFPLSGLIPFIQAAVGVAKTTSNYSQITSSDSGATIFLPKQNKTTFTWSIGLGADATLTKSIHLGLGYLYTHYGRVSLSTSGNDNPIDQAFSMQVYSNTALFGLVYLMNG